MTHSFRRTAIATGGCREVGRLARPRGMRAWLGLGLGPALALLLAGCGTLRDLGLTGDAGQGQADTVALDAEEPAPGETGIAYRATLTGVDEESLRKLLEGSSQLLARMARPVAAIGVLRRRADADVDRLQTALRSEGYYAAEVRARIDPDSEPVQVAVEVTPGAQYLLAAYDIVYTDIAPPPPAVRPAAADLGLHIGMPARAPDIVAAQRQALDLLAGRGYPLADVADRKTTVDHGTTTMTVVLTVDAGPAARFGPVALTGLSRVKEDYVRSLLTIAEGAPYDREAVEASRTALLATGLFDSVEMTRAQAVDANGALPITIGVAESMQRSIGFGGSYSTSEGFGGEIFWEHRNLLGRNETLHLSVTGAEIEQSLKATGRKPGFLRPDQALLADAAITNRNTSAFDEKSLASGVGVERPFGKYWRATAGVSGEYSILTDDLGKRDFRLVGLPVTGRRDTTDNPLNPTRGTRLNLSLTPYGGGGGNNTLFFGVGSASLAAYYSVDAQSRYVLAGRMKLGSLVGEETVVVPANKRFYAGGGGSIRGFGFQRVGPLDAQNDPLGGRSVVEVSGELRVRVSESVGIVPFVDGGQVFDASYPDFAETLRWAGGLGVRYFSGIGPLRLDVAVPFDKRSGDDSFEFYISLGQAF